MKIRTWNNAILRVLISISEHGMRLRLYVRHHNALVIKAKKRIYLFFCKN